MQDQHTLHELGRYRFVLVLFSVAVSLTLIFYLFPFTGISSQPNQVKRVFFVDNISNAHQLMVNRFNEIFAGQIEVVPISLPFEKFTTNERKELLTRTLRGMGGRIDVFAVDQIWVPRFAKWAEPLDSYFSNREMAELLPQVVKTTNYQGDLVGIPLYLDVGVLYYRRDLIQQLPENESIIEQLNESISWLQLAEIRDQYFPGQPVYLFQGDDYEGLICNFLEVLGGNGGRLDLEQPTGLLTAEAAASLNLLRQFIYESGISPEEVIHFNENETYLYALQHDIPFFRAWPTQRGNSPIPDELRWKVDQLAFAPIPHFPGKESKTIFGGWNLMLSKTSQMKPEAIEFIKFASSIEAQRILYSSGGLLPVLKVFYSDEEFLSAHPDLGFLKGIIATGVHRPRHPDYTKISDLLSFQISQALQNNVTTETALSRAAENIIPLIR